MDRMVTEWDGEFTKLFKTGLLFVLLFVFVSYPW